MRNTQYEDKLPKSAALAVFAACAAAVIAMDNSLGNSVFAYICASYAEETHATLYLFQSIGHVIGMVAAFIVGPLTMCVSPKRMIQAAIIGMLAVGCVYVFGGGRVPYSVMILCSAIDGMESSIISCLPAAVVAANCDSVHKTIKYAGIVSACTMAGGVFFSIFGGYIASVAGWQMSYLLYFIAVPIFVIVTKFMPVHMNQVHVRNEVKKDDWKLITTIPLFTILIFFQYFLFYVATFTFKSCISEYVVNTYSLGTSAQAGMANSIVTFAGVLIGISFGRVSHKLRRWLVPCLALSMTFGFVSMSLITSTVFGCLLGAVLIGFGKGGMMPAVVGELSVRLDERVVPLCVSLLVGFMNLGNAASIYLVEPLARVFGDISIPNKLTATIIFGFIAFAAAIGIYVLPRGKNKKPHYHDQPSVSKNLRGE